MDGQFDRNIHWQLLENNTRIIRVPWLIHSYTQKIHHSTHTLKKKNRKKKTIKNQLLSSKATQKGKSRISTSMHINMT